MKLFKSEYDVAKPSVKRISVPTDTEAYAVGIKVLENGKDMHLPEDEVTMQCGGNVLSASGTFNGYNVFNFSSESTETDNIAKVKVNAKAHYVDALSTLTSPGPTSTIIFTQVPNISSLAGLTMTEPEQCYSEFKIYDTEDNLVSTLIEPSGMTQMFGSQEAGYYYFLTNPNHELRYVRQLGISVDYGLWKVAQAAVLVPEKLDYFTFPDAEELTSILAIRGNLTGVPADYKVKFRQYYTGKDLSADFDLYIDEYNSSIGEIADQPKFTKTIELSGVYADDTTFNYTIPVV